MGESSRVDYIMIVYSLVVRLMVAFYPSVQCFQTTSKRPKVHSYDCVEDVRDAKDRVVRRRPMKTSRVFRPL